MKRDVLGSLLIAAVLASVGVTAGPASAVEPDFHGIVSQGYLHSTDYNYMNESDGGSFAFNELLLNVSAPIEDNMQVGAQFIGRNLGAKGNEDITLDWAFGDLRLRQELGLRCGKIKMPHGLYNQTRDVDMVRNTLFLPQSVYAENIRDVLTGFEGFSIYGTIPVAETSCFEYEIFTGTIDLDATQYPASNVIAPRVAELYGDYLPMAHWSGEMDKLYGGALRWNTPLKWLRLGATNWTAHLDGDCSFVGPQGSFSPTIEKDINYFYVLSAEYTHDQLGVVFEFRRHSIDGVLDHVLDANGDWRTFELHKRKGGYYGQATWQFNDWFELGALHSMFFPNYHDRNTDDPENYMRDLGLTARFDITDYWLIKIEGHAMSGSGGVSKLANIGNDRSTEHWSQFGVKSTFYF